MELQSGQAEGKWSFMHFREFVADNLPQEWDGSDADSSEESVEERVSGKVRNCLTVMCGVSAMMLFTIILMVVVAVYVLLIIQSTSSPLVRDLS